MGETRPRGRRPAGSDARGDIIEAARVEFADRGLEGASMRAIARRAGVDPALVRHYFPEKDDLFVLSVVPPGVDPPQIAERVAGESLDGLGERLITEVLTIWGRDGGVRFRALVSAMAGGRTTPRVFVSFLIRTVFSRILVRLPPETGELRVELAASQAMGLMALRYVFRVEPLASMPVADVARIAGPTIDRYLTGPLPSSSGAGP